MAQLTQTQITATEFSGNFRLVVVAAAVGSASDTIVLTEANTSIKSILAPVGAVVTGGLDANFTTLQVSVAALTITIVSLKATGAAADDFTGTTVAITVIGTTSGA